MGTAYVGRYPRDYIVIFFRGRFGNPEFEIPTVIKRGFYIPSIDGMRRPGTLTRQFFINWDLGSGRRNWGAVEIKRTIDLSIG